MNILFKSVVHCNRRIEEIVFPIVFSVYIDGLLVRLTNSNVGCYVGSFFVGALAYADDIVLLIIGDSKNALFLLKNRFLALVLPNLNRSGSNFADTYCCTEYTCRPTRPRSARWRLQAKPKRLRFL